MKQLGCLAVLLVFCCFVFVGIHWYATSFHLKKGLETPMKRVANASDAKAALFAMNDAIKYLEDNRMTSGNSSFVFDDPANDVGYFYNNMKGAQSELELCVKNNASQLEQSNVLIRVKEVVSSTGEKGTVVDTPANMDVYPNVWMNTIVRWFFLIVIVILCIIAYTTLMD